MYVVRCVCPFRAPRWRQSRWRCTTASNRRSGGCRPRSRTCASAAASKGARCVCAHSFVGAVRCGGYIFLASGQCGSFSCSRLVGWRSRSASRCPFIPLQELTSCVASLCVWVCVQRQLPVQLESLAELPLLRALEIEGIGMRLLWPLIDALAKVTPAPVPLPCVCLILLGVRVPVVESLLCPVTEKPHLLPVLAAIYSRLRARCCALVALARSSPSARCVR